MRLIIRLFLLILTIVILISCNLPSENDDYIIPEWQEAIFTVKADGTEKEKITDVESVIGVKFIPDTQELLYAKYNDEISGYSLYVFNITDSLEALISGDINIRYDIAISEDGQDIVFCGSRSNRSTIYDIYKYNRNTQAISNLTYTSERSEKNISFINYQGTECILYSCIYDHLGTSYKSIDIINPVTSSTVTLLSGEAESIFGYRLPIYDAYLDGIFFIDDYNGLYKLHPIINGDISFISNSMGTKLILDDEQGSLFFVYDEIYKLNTENNEITPIADFNYFDYSNNILVVTSDTNNVNDEIYTINSDGSNQQLITRNGSIPSFSKDGLKLVYFGQYEINNEEVK